MRTKSGASSSASSYKRGKEECMIYGVVIKKRDEGL